MASHNKPGTPSYERSLIALKEWKRANPERHKEGARLYMKEAYAADPQKYRDRVKLDRIQKKLELIEAYGGKCKCCGEERHEFLSIDHIKGGGRKHTESLGLHGAAFHAWLRKHGYPQEDYRLLCMNCNFAIGHSGYCPHQREKELSQPLAV
jgi:hypothetical protein